MAHISTRLAREIELGAVRRDRMDLSVVEKGGGGTVRNRRWSQFLREYDIAYPVSRRDASILQSVIAAFLATGGGEDTFDFEDWRENAVIDEPIGTGDGSTTVFNLIKTYTFGSASHVRRIYRPVTGIVVKKAGVIQTSGFTVNYDTGFITFTVAPASGLISWSGSFNVPVRFDRSFASTGLTPDLEHIDTFTLYEERL